MNVLSKFVVVSKIRYLTDILKLFDICSKFKSNLMKRKALFVKFMSDEKSAASAIRSCS